MKNFFKKLRFKYRLVIYNDTTFEEVFNYKLTRLNVFTLIGFLTIFLIIIITLFIAFTPLREYIPGYPDGKTEKNIHANFRKTDSLEHELHIMSQYFNNIKSIIEGNEPTGFPRLQDTIASIIHVPESSRIKADSLLNKPVNQQNMFPESAETKTKKPISDMQFFPPVKGLISSRFDLSLGHFGCDIVGAQDETIHSILDGTVVLASWTIEAGYILQIQHDNNFISIYKHMREKLVEQGSHINAGDPVAIIGGSGEFSTGPHLHFELWYNGTPLDPEDYIIF